MQQSTKTRTWGLIVSGLAATLGLVASVAAWPAPGSGPSMTTQDDRSGQQQKSSARELDKRIADPTKITESTLPPLPDRVVLPKPADFRIAGESKLVPISSEHFAKALTSLDQGLEYLLAQQEPGGSWLSQAMAVPTDEPGKPSSVSVAVTALAVKAIVQARPEWILTPECGRALAYIRSAQAADGSFAGGALTNYVTSTVVMALSSVDATEFHDDIQDAVAWMRINQWDETEGLTQRQDWFGGAGYGDRGRPDLSNTQMMLDAMYEAGVSPDDPAMKRALAFASRTQNLRETNSAAWAGNDGGFIYTPANGGESMASEHAGEGRYGEHIPEGQFRSLRSYGSMTYAGFKSMIYAGLSPDDVRVRAAYDWIRRHYTFAENPGVGQQGLFYYYHTMARALTVGQQHHIVDDAGDKHNWREELIEALIARQSSEDGSWRNEADRWMEGMPEMATIYAVLTLGEVLKPVLDLTGDDED